MPVPVLKPALMLPGKQAKLCMFEQEQVFGQYLVAMNDLPDCKYLYTDSRERLFIQCRRQVYRFAIALARLELMLLLLPPMPLTTSLHIPLILALVKYSAPAFVYPINNCDLMEAKRVKQHGLE